MFYRNQKQITNMFDNIIDDEFTNACDTTVQGLWFGRK